MQPNNFTITGHIIDRQTKQGISGLRIEAWDKDLFFDDFVGSAETDTEGFFEIRFNEAYFRELIARRPDLYFKLYSADEDISGEAFELTVTPPSGEPLTGSGDSVFWKLAPGETNVSISLALPVASKLFKVKGTILQPDGTPVAGVTVKAFDKDLRHEEKLGEVSTNQAGEYEITYTREQFRRAEKKSADLIVRAYDKDGTEQASSSILFNAKLSEEVNLTLSGEAYQGPSDYETLLQALAPVLDGVQPAELTEDDIAFLTGETDIDRQRIHCLNRAAKLALTVDHSDLPTEVFYGFARKSLPTGSLKELLSRSLPVLRQTLEEALQENIVPANLEEQLEEIIAALQALMVEQASVASEPGGVTFTVLLETCESLDAQKRDRLLEFLASYRGNVEDLWTELEQGTVFSPQEVEDIRFTLQFGTLSRNHLPMVTVLQTLREVPLPGFSDHPIQEIRELARFSAEDWLGLIQSESGGQPIGFPPDTPGEDDDEKAHNYAEHLFRQVEASFPTAAVAYQLKDIDTEVWNWGPQLSEFILENPNFDLKTTRIEPYLQHLPRLLSRSTGANDDEAIKEELKTLQRLFQVSPRFDHIHTLRQAGFNSARSIARMTRESFLDRFGADLGGSETANRLYETTSDRVAFATNIWSKWSSQFEQAQPGMIPAKPTPPPDFIEEQIPNWTELFGSPDYCTCKHCRSIYSPAAYFVELLQFLENESTYQSQETSGPDSDYTNGLDLLLSRRPDLEHIELTCANTNTPLPYVDLVNEILERAVVPSEPETSWPQTTWSAEELTANPEHVEREAYKNVLNQAIYPWNLPFDLYAEEARIYLKHLGVSRSHLMEVFFQDSVPSGAAYLNEDISREYLEITEQEWKLLSGETFQNDSQWPALWGLTESNNDIENPYDSENNPISGTWDQVLRHCWILLKRSGLMLDELKELLRLRFVNPQGTITIEGEEHCKLHCLRLHFPGDVTEPPSSDEAKAAFRRICLLVRLRRRLNWSAYELDQALTAFDQTGQVDDVFMMKASHVQRLREQLDISLQEMLCWWGDIPTSREDDDKPSLFETLFLNNSVLPKDASPEDDWPYFEELLTEPPPQSSELIKNHLPRLTAALRASSDDILLILAWQPSWATGLRPNWNMLTLPNLSRLFRVLSLCRAMKLSVQEFLALIEMRGQALDPFDDTKPTQNLLLLVDDLQKLRSSGFQIVELDYLLRHRFQSPETEEADLRETTLVLEQLRAGLQKIDLGSNEAEGRRLIKQQLSQVLKLDPAITERLLEKPQEESEGAGAWITASESDRDSIEPFLDINFVVRGTLIRETFAEQIKVRSEEWTEQYGTLIKLKKVATVLSRLRLSMKEARYLFESGQSGWLDLDTLPASEKDDANFTGWIRLVDVFHLRDRIGDTTPDLFDLFDMAREGEQEQLFDLLAKRLGWKREDFDALVEHFGYERDDFRDERPFLRLESCFEMSHRIGVSIKEPVRILYWAAANVTAEVARSIKLAAKSKYDDKRWLEVTKPLQDGLRERKRQSLVAYLTGLWRWTPEQLYACYLIDVDMQACMFTSRIKQAISSVQLFVQRCLLGLESGVDIEPQAARWWDEWMKNYRVWEANRKIFAYPENWIEPELRDDKSPFFEELEKELRQNDITPETAEKAYLNYLEKLNRVSRLEIVAQHYDHESERHYVFGRTPSTPHVYYFRYRDNCRVWSPWEKIDLDIEADHLIPAVWNRRLYLFWPIFKEVSKKQSSPVEGEPYGQASKVWDIKIAWSEYWQGKWGEKKVTPVPLRPKGAIVLGSMFPCREVPVIDGDDLVRAASGVSPAPFFGDEKNAGLFYFQPIFSDTELHLRTLHVFDWASNSKRGRYSPTGEYHFVGNSGKPTQYSKAEERFLPISNGGYIKDLALNSSTAAVYFKAPTQESIDGFFNVNDRSYPAYINSTFFWWHPEQNGIEFKMQFSDYSYAWTSAFVYQDASRALLVLPKIFGKPVVSTTGLQEIFDQLSWTEAVTAVLALYADPTSILRYRAEAFYHPYVTDFIAELNRYGIDGLLCPKPGASLFRQGVEKVLFDDGEEAPYKKADHGLIDHYPKEEITFEDEEAYALYNWELFFHIPLLIADRLSTNQQFEAAQKWYHYIFDPTEVIPKDDPTWGAWRFGPFVKCQGSENSEKCFETLMQMLDRSDPKFADRVTRWRNNPFQPHLIARLRDGVPYMKTVVMKYIDNLIAWGDALFRRDTIESINEATQLYILAASILGPRPQQLPELERAGQTYSMLKEGLDALGNTLVPIENEIVHAGESESNTASLKLLPPFFSYEFVLKPDLCVQPMGSAMATQNMAVPKHALTMGTHKGAMFAHEISEGLSVGYQTPAEFGMAIPQPTTLYFCIPANNKLLGYWDTVADRLFKIRHCMNIKGIVRELPLFEPPIEPGLLVRAAAAGIDLSSIVSEMSPELPHYRFGTMLQKALELCADVKTLGGALLAALEKRDVEELSLLRSTHELRVLDALTEVKEQQVEEAQATVKGLERAKESAELQRDHYASLEFMNPAEKQQLDLMAASMMTQQVGQFLQLAASLARRTPDFTGGYCSLGGAGMATYGGSNEAGGLEASAWYANSIASMLNTAATQSSILGGYRRRKEDWDLRKRTAAIEAKQIDKQITAADIRLAIAEKNRENHLLQIEQAAEVDEYLRSKFTDQELYEWMVSQISTLYFQSYQLAYDLAKRAEHCYRFERGLEESSFIQFGYWDNLKKGLLSGEKLHYDLKRMEASYLEKNSRDYELTKHISLALLAPDQLIVLKETGKCEITIPEELFDLDYPGHYMRRIKNVSISIPCVVGPYVGVNATLTLVSDSTRLNTDTSNGYARIENIENPDEESNDSDPRFKDNWVTEQSIAASHAQNDSGLFELNFRDERYLPFEGAGAISKWELELSGKWQETDENGNAIIHDVSQFDFDTISDVILHMHYTANAPKNGSEEFKKAARESLVNQLSSLPQTRMFSLRHEFPNEWHNLKQGNSTAFTLTKQHLPQFVQEHGPSIDSVTWYARVNGNPKSFEMFLDGTPFSLDQDPSLNNLNVGPLNDDTDDTSNPIILGTEFTLSAANTDDLEELVLLIKYTLDS